MVHDRAKAQVPRCYLLAVTSAPGPNVLLGQHLEEIVARDVFVEVNPATVDLDAFARPGWSLSAGVVDLAVDLEQAVVLDGCRGGGVDAEDHPAATEVRGQGNPFAFHGHLAAAVELERDQPLVERERAGFEHGRAGGQRVGSVAAGRLGGDVE